jgi:hypothetical protein
MKRPATPATWWHCSPRTNVTRPTLGYDVIVADPGFPPMYATRSCPSGAGGPRRDRPDADAVRGPHRGGASPRARLSPRAASCTALRLPEEPTSGAVIGN